MPEFFRRQMPDPTPQQEAPCSPEETERLLADYRRFPHDTTIPTWDTVGLFAAQLAACDAQLARLTSRVTALERERDDADRFVDGAMKAYAPDLNYIGTQEAISRLCGRLRDHETALASSRALVAAVDKFLALPNWQHRCGEWKDVNCALGDIAAAAHKDL